MKKSKLLHKLTACEKITKLNTEKTVRKFVSFLFFASFSAAGIFFCFLVKEKAPDLIGETDVEAQRSPERHKNKLEQSQMVLQQEHSYQV